MPTIRFVLIGGFLGTGKTTTIARLARSYLARGLKVGIVTNDQAEELVDTHNLKAQGFDVDEVAGACFCCRFDELTAAVEKLQRRQRPDVVLAEPVGSCADLVATVIQPIKRFFAAQFDVAPYSVIVKPSHGMKILSGQKRIGFSPKAAYILRMQLHEADCVIINRIDQLSRSEVDELERLVRAEVPGVPVLRLSALTGEGFDSLLEMLERRGPSGQRILEIDYDTYAAGEAELGWLNSRFRLQATDPFALDELLLRVMNRLRVALASQEAEPAHLKAIGLAERFHAVANLVSSDSAVELSVRSDGHSSAAELIINARVAADPELIRGLTEHAVAESAASLGATAQPVHVRSLRPGRPVPTHRFTEPV